MPTFNATYAVADIDADFGLVKAERDEVLALITPDETREAIIRAMQDVIQKKLETVKPYPWLARAVLDGFKAAAETP